jgi:inorganic pyrophosphatase
MAQNYATKFIGKTVTVKMDRPMGSKHPKWGFIYPVNYGEILYTKAPDGEAVDAYVLGVFESKEEFTGKCIAVIHRMDNDDDKLIVVPEDKTYSDEQILAITEFQERFFKPTIVREEPAD